MGTFLSARLVPPIGWMGYPLLTEWGIIPISWMGTPFSRMGIPSPPLSGWGTHCQLDGIPYQEDGVPPVIRMSTPISRMGYPHQLDAYPHWLDGVPPSAGLCTLPSRPPPISLMGYPIPTPHPHRQDGDTLILNITFPYPSDAGGKKKH